MYCFIICALLVGNISAVCDFCHSNVLGSLCSGEIVCPTQTQVVTVQCYVKKIISSEPIGQLLIQGSCASIENYVHFCLENNIREIVMLDTDSPVLHCSEVPSCGKTPPPVSFTYLQPITTLQNTAGYKGMCSGLVISHFISRSQ